MAIVLNNIQIKVYQPTTHPKQSKEDIEYSVDVFIIDENGMNGLAYYHFTDEQWHFHTDTLVDYNEIGSETKWVWYYPPVQKELVF